MKLGLVLGGGGAVGIAWEIALLAALEAAGVGLRHAGVVVGTSAGSIVGAQVFGGRTFEAMLAEQRQTDQPAQMSVRSGGQAANPDVKDLFAKLAGIQDRGERGRLLGSLALAAPPPFPEPMYLAMIQHTIQVSEWPVQMRFLPTGTDCHSGERVVFEADMDVPLVTAVAASCCVSSLVPAVTIKGRRYIDGGCGSSSNADVLLGTGVDKAIFIGPFGGPESPPLPTAAQCLSEELTLLSNAGIQTLVITPAAKLAQRVGTDFLNPALRPVGVECGTEDGRRAVERVGRFLRT
ncbi:MAG: patatin-like phospholipase family protein [Steroidobacteraceae bacterium]